MANVTYTRNEGRPSSDTSFPQFFMDTVQGIDLNGRPTFRQVERVKIIMPGNPWSQPVQNVDQGIIDRWPDQYEKFKKMEEPSMDGIPLEEWPILTRAMVKELKNFEVYTVEQAANLPDSATQRIMGGMTLRAKARAYLDEREELMLMEKVTAENEKLSDEVSSLRRQVVELGELCERLNSQVVGMAEGRSPIATTAPMHMDPYEMAKTPSAPQAPVSALAALEAMNAKPRRGRPPKSEAA